MILAAAGTGERLGAGVPKALHRLVGEPLLVHALRRVLQARCVVHVVVAAPPGAQAAVAELITEFRPVVSVVPGGDTRHASVGAALRAVPRAVDVVLVHDAARALAPPELFERVAAAVAGGHDAVVPVLPVIDTIKQVDGTGRVRATLDRSVLRAVQTPQGFRRSVLVAAHAAGSATATDDAGLAERLGVPVHTVAGSTDAFKVTHPHDLALAEVILAVGSAG